MVTTADVCYATEMIADLNSKNLDIERRLPVWCALSELFLDTELQPSDYQWIADVLRASGYSRAELRAVFENEVAPAFVPNLFSVAGQWAGWREEDVRDIVLRSLQSGTAARIGSWLGKRLYRGHLTDQWNAVESHLIDR